MPELACLSGQSGRVAVVADRCDDVGAGALGGERAGANLLADGPRRRIGLAGEDGLVECEAVAALQPSVAHDLVAGLEQHRVALDHRRDANATRLPVADDGRRRRDERRQPVERPLRAHLLRDADHGVGDEDGEEQSVLRLSEDERDDAEDEQDQVEDREDVRDDDAVVRAARPLRRSRPRSDPPLRLALREPSRHRRRRHSCSFASGGVAPGTGGSATKCGGRRRSGRCTSRSSSRS